MIKTIIVDDEPLAINVIEKYISKLPEINLVGSFENAIDANKFLNKNDVDLIFLDIKMPEITGIEFLQSLKHPPLVVFTTAFSNYALESYNLDAVDYLLKPIPFDRFLKAVNKVIDRLGDTEGEDHFRDDYFFVKADKKLIKVNYEDIIYVEGLKDYVIIRMEKSRVITLQTMKSLEDKLLAHLFQRVHRSFIVNTEKINSIVGNMVEVSEKGEEKLIPIGKNYKNDLMKIIDKKRI